MFLSTFEKQLDAKRRIVVPQEFRTTATSPSGAGGFDGVFCFPSIEAGLPGGGGQALFQQYMAVIEELPFGDPLRSAVEFSVLGGMRQLAFDTAGRIVLPDSFCEQFGLTDWVVLIGLGQRFQIWSLDAFRAQREAQGRIAREQLTKLRIAQRDVALAGPAASSQASSKA